MVENEMIRINIRVSPEVHQYYKERSTKTGVSMSSLMYLALEQAIRQETMSMQLPELIRMAKEMEEQQKLLGNPTPFI